MQIKNEKKILVVTMCVCMAFMTAACSTGTTNNETTSNSSAGDTTAGENASVEGESESAAEDTKVDVYNTIFQDNGYVKDIKASDLVQLYDYSQLKQLQKQMWNQLRKRFRLQLMNSVNYLLQQSK